MSWHSRQVTVWVFALCAEHLTAVVMARDSITSRTQGELEERHGPGIGEVLSTMMCCSAHSHGVPLNGGFQASYMTEGQLTV